MKRRPPNLPSKAKAKAKDRAKAEANAPNEPPSRFAPKAFLAATPATVQGLCEALAAEAARRFVLATNTPWVAVATSIVADVRASGHDLVSLDDTGDVRQWQATWYHPRGTFSLSLSFRAPGSVEVTWQTSDATFVARA